LIISLPGLLLGGARGLLGVLGSVVGGIVSVAAKIGVAFLGVTGGALAGFATAIQTSAQAALEFARNAGQLRGMTGLSFASSAGVLQRFGALGMNNQTTANTFGGQDPEIFRMKAAAYNLPGFESESFIPKLAATFQRQMEGGLMGRFQASAMMNMFGMNNPQMRAMAMLPQAKIQGQLAYSQNINVTLGLSPEAIRRYAEEIPLFIGRVSTFWEALKMKVAGEVLPMLEMGLNFVTNLASQNAGNIGEWVETAVEFLFVRAPILAMSGVNMVLGAAQVAVGAVIGWVGMAAQMLPALLGNATQWLADTIRNLADGFGRMAPIVIAGIATALSGLGHMVADWMRAFADQLRTFETGQGPLYGIALSIAHTIDFLSTAFSFFGKIIEAFAGSIHNISTGLNNVVSGLVNAAIDSARWMTKIGLANPGSLVHNIGQSTKWEYDDRWATYQGSKTQNWAGTNLAGMLEGLRGSGQLGASANTIDRRADQFAAFTDRVADGFYNGAMSGARNMFDKAHGSANWLAPPGEKNKGTIAGEWAGGHLNEMAGLLQKYVKNPVDNMANWSQAYQRSLGSEQQRADRWQELIAATKGVEKAIRDTAKDGGSMGDTSTAIAAYMLKAFAQESGAAIRRVGR
ncbi:MAG TPA: hypothetical protein VGB45_06175, partial [Abditibacterium sp.]